MLKMGDRQTDRKTERFEIDKQTERKKERNVNMWVVYW
jgi:hypothetical protein